MPGMKTYMGAPSEKPDLPPEQERDFIEADMGTYTQALLDKYGAKDEAELKSRIVQKGQSIMEAKKDRPAMKDGGMAKGKGGKTYQHNYATGGQVVDHLSKVVGPPPTSVQAATATVSESPAERSKRLRSGG